MMRRFPCRKLVATIPEEGLMLVQKDQTPQKVTIVINSVLPTHPSRHLSSVRLTPGRKTTINSTTECTVTLKSPRRPTSNTKKRTRRPTFIFLSAILEITEPLEKGHKTNSIFNPERMSLAYDREPMVGLPNPLYNPSRIVHI